MGFVYNKPLSMEQIFSMFNKNGGNKIDKEEVANAKNIKIFEGFQIQEGWTLEDFERENLETYSRYEELTTEAWAKQQKENGTTAEEREKAGQILKELHNHQMEKLEKLQNDDIKETVPKFGIDDNGVNKNE